MPLFKEIFLTVILMGADIHVIETDDHWDLEKHALKLCADLKNQGFNPYYIPVSGTTPHSCLGYVRCGLELMEQMDQQNLSFDYVYTPFGTGGIFTSLLFVFNHYGLNGSFNGISVNRQLPECEENLQLWWDSLNKLFGQNRMLPKKNNQVYEHFIGREYGDPTSESLDAIMLMAEKEGIILDPVYSGKTFSGLYSHFKASKFKSGDTVMLPTFWWCSSLICLYRCDVQALKEKRIAV